MSTPALLTAGIYFRNTVLRSRSLFVLVLIGIDIMLAFGFRDESEAGFGLLTSEILIGFMLPFIALLFGTSVIADEVENGTITYLLTRPISRTTLYLSRLGAAILTVVGAVMIANIANLLILGGSVSADDTLRAVGTIIAGSVVYTALFGAISAFFYKRPFMIGVLFLLFYDQPASLLPRTARYVTLKANLENIAGLVPPGEGIFAILQTEVPVSASVIAVGVVIAVALAGGIAAINTGEYHSRSEA